MYVCVCVFGWQVPVELHLQAHQSFEQHTLRGIWDLVITHLTNLHSLTLNPQTSTAGNNANSSSDPAQVPREGLELRIGNCLYVLQAVLEWYFSLVLSLCLRSLSLALFLSLLLYPLTLCR